MHFAAQQRTTHTLFLAQQWVHSMQQPPVSDPGTPHGFVQESYRMLSAMAAYIPERLVRAQLDDPSPGRVRGAFWQGSILFADLSGFTMLSQQLSLPGKQGAEEISSIVNQLFDALVSEVYAHRGMLLKFGGDALTAFFDADTLGPLHAPAAAQAALSMQQRMQSFAAIKTRADTFRLCLRVGVHSGQVFAAEVGDEVHIELVVTGVDVNRVALAQDIASPGDVVITEQTATLLKQGTLLPRQAGFQCLLELPTIHLPPPTHHALHLEQIATQYAPDMLETRLAALRPYLVRGLPQRFLDQTTTLQGEFRPVSVLFINFCNFSKILHWTGNDAQTAAMLLNAYFRRAQEVIRHYDGIVNKVDMYRRGDKLMILFGAPGAHEDDPLRAVRCALDMQGVLHEANEDIIRLLQDIPYQHTSTAPSSSSATTAEHPNIQALRLQQRVGINTGTVFAGRVGGSQRYEYTVMGSEVNLAARLMEASDDGHILISSPTRAAVYHQIALEDYKPLHLKGMTEPIQPARVTGIRTHTPTYIQAIGHDLYKGPLIGRDAELTLMKREGESAWLGNGRVVAVVGEAGIGKTRLSEELIHSADIQEYFIISTGDCQSYEQRVPYSTIRSPLRHMLDVDRSFTPEPAHLLRLFTVRIANLAPHYVRFAPLFGDVIGIALPESPLTQGLTTEQRHDRLQEMVIHLLLKVAEEKPLLLRLDNVHWIDASSLELLGRLTHVIADTAMLVLLAYRYEPPIDEPWLKHPATTRIILRELSPYHSELLLNTLLEGSQPEDIRSLIERTQGNPFFIEELVRTLLDSGMVTRDSSGTWYLNCPLNQITIPTSIEGLLQARLDRLEETQHELVQLASVVGRRFEHPVIESVYSEPALLDSQIEQLMSNDIIIAEQASSIILKTTPVPANRTIGTYQFRHALLRDVAYESILYARRRELHRRVAQSIEQQEPHLRDEKLAILAQHYLLAEAWSDAFDYHMAAGIQAQNRYANSDALDLFTTALTIATNHLNNRFWNTIEIHERYGDIHLLLGAYDEAQAAYLKALELADSAASDEAHRASDDQRIPLIIRLHRLLANIEERRASYDQAFDWLERGLIKAGEYRGLEVGRCYLLGAGISQRQGRHIRSLKWALRAFQELDHTDNRKDRAHAHYVLGGTYNKLGQSQEAIACIGESLHLYEGIGDINGQANAHINLSLALANTGRWEDAFAHGEIAMELKETIGDLHGQAILANNLGDIKRHTGDYEAAMHYFGIALDTFTQLGSDYGCAVLYMNMGATRLGQGLLPEAMTCLEQSRQLFERAGSEEFLAELYRIYAELAHCNNQPTEALQWADRSLEQACKLEARFDEGASRRIRGLILLDLGQKAESLHELRQAYALLQDVNNPQAVAQCLDDLARITDDLAEAYAARHEAQRIRETNRV